MSTATSYLGLELDSPVLAAASPLSLTVPGVRDLAKAGASGIVLFSLFEEQLENDGAGLMRRLSEGASYAEVISTIGQSDRIRMGPAGYLRHIEACSAAVDVPIIASINAVHNSSWSEYVPLLQDAGARALELNLYDVVSDPTVTSQEVEDRYVQLVKTVCASSELPVAVKLSPYFTSLAHVAKRLVDAGARGLVLFNRFYQPDVDVEDSAVVPRLKLSHHDELLLRVQWTGLLREHVDADLGTTGGIRRAEDIVKLGMMGSSACFVASTLLEHGLEGIQRMRRDLDAWLSSHDFRSFRDLVERRDVQNLSSLQRVQYLRTLESWDPDSRTLR